MPLIIFTGTTHESVSIPDDAGVERSCSGAIHLLPKRPRRVTEGELEYIQTNFPGIALTVMPGQPITPTQAETVADGTEKQQDDTESEPKPKPVDDSESGMAPTAGEMLELSIPKILDELEVKRTMMDASDFEMLVQALIAKEKGKPEPRSTLVDKLEAELE